MRFLIVLAMFGNISCVTGHSNVGTKSSEQNFPNDTELGTASDGTKLFTSELLDSPKLESIGWTGITWGGIFTVDEHRLLFVTSLNNIVLLGMPIRSSEHFVDMNDGRILLYSVPDSFETKRIKEIYRIDGHYYTVWLWNRECKLLFRPIEYVSPKNGDSYYWAKTGKDRFAGYLGNCTQDGVPQDYLRPFTF